MDLRLVVALSTAALLASAAGQITQCEYTHGLQTYPDPNSCDTYYKCANGTLTLERCANGLMFSGEGAVYDNCDYYWKVECGRRPAELSPARKGSCPYSYGIFPVSTDCHDHFLQCADGKANVGLCAEGLAYDDVSHVCNWPDVLPQCSIGNAEEIVGYSCPDVIPVGSASLRFGLYPRFSTGLCDRLVICVEYSPRLVKCSEGMAVDESSLTCVPSELVYGCGGA